MSYGIKLRDARRKIEDEIYRKGPYSHNIVSITLRQVAKWRGAEAANKLVVDLQLEKVFGIRPAAKLPDGQV